MDAHSGYIMENQNISMKEIYEVDGKRQKGKCRRGKHRDKRKTEKENIENKNNEMVDICLVICNSVKIYRISYSPCFHFFCI